MIPPRLVLLGCLMLSAAYLVGGGAARAADQPDPAIARLAAVLGALDSDPALADKAPLERFKARQSLADAQVVRSRDRAHALILANAWVLAARDAAQAELLNQQSAQLDRERDQIMLEASRRDAELARREADRLRLQSLAREEEAQRLAESMAQDQQAVEHSEAQASQALKLADARARRPSWRARRRSWPPRSPPIRSRTMRRRRRRAARGTGPSTRCPVLPSPAAAPG